MPTPIDFTRLQEVLSQRAGWIELAVVLLCFAIAWAVDRRVRVRGDGSRIAKIGAGSVNRLVFPLTALALLLLSRAVLEAWLKPFFLEIAIPVAIALALIGLLVYGIHGLFGGERKPVVSERTISFTIVGALLLYYVGVLQHIRMALAELRITIGKSEVSVLDLGRGALVLVLAVVAALWLSSLVDRRLLRASPADANVRVVLGKVVRAFLLLVGVLFALSLVGIDLTVLSVFGGALGVGIGLGLQKLASNYIAGFTILLDRSIRLGDVVTVDNRHGVVTEVTTRYVVVRSLDGTEAIVPNDTLVTTTVLNHSYDTPETRIGVTVQISYESDLDTAMRLMEEIALEQPRVLRVPTAPAVFVARLAEDGIELELGVWINDPQNGQLNLRSAINRGILKAFRAHGIHIPGPRREIQVRSEPADGKSSLPVVAPAESDR